eukprot:COSAG04_NODE_4894_length_1837_cov_1.617376_2_plen_102_part_00
MRDRNLRSARLDTFASLLFAQEEILSGSNTLYFSPDNQRLAFLRFDDSAVPQYNYTFWGTDPGVGAYPATMRLRYPKPVSTPSLPRLLAAENGACVWAMMR